MYIICMFLFLYFLWGAHTGMKAEGEEHRQGGVGFSDHLIKVEEGRYILGS